MNITGFEIFGMEKLATNEYVQKFYEVFGGYRGGEGECKCGVATLRMMNGVHECMFCAVIKQRIAIKL